MNECQFPDSFDFNIGGVQVDPCSFEEVETLKNVTVQILRCRKCGKVTVGWMRQDNTEEVFEDM